MLNAPDQRQLTDLIVAWNAYRFAASPTASTATMGGASPPETEVEDPHEARRRAMVSIT